MCICIYFSNLLSIQYLWHKLRITSYDKKWLKVSSAFKKGRIIYSCESLGTYRLHWTSEVALKRGKVGSVCGFGISAVDLFLDYMYIKSKLSFVGISQADPAGLQKAPRWAKMWSKGFQTKTCLDFVILSLSLSLDLCSHIFCSYYLYVRYGYYNGSIFGFSNGNCAHLPVTGRKKKKKKKKLGKLWLGPMLICSCWQKHGTAFRLVFMQQTHSLLKRANCVESWSFVPLGRAASFTCGWWNA